MKLLRVPDYIAVAGAIALFWAGLSFGAREKALPQGDAHNSFYIGSTRDWKRPGSWAGDDQIQVEVFKDGDGSWVGVVWEKGRCWQGKLAARLR